MLTTIRLYREYRRQGMRRAWSLAGMGKVARSIGTGFVAGVLIVAATATISSQAQAIQDAADNRVAAKLASQKGEIEALYKIVAACLGDREGALWIGDELHLCRAVPIGVRK